MGKALARVYNGSLDASGKLFARFARSLHFPFVSQCLSQIPFSIGWKLRRAVYSGILPSVGKDVVLHHGVVLEDERSQFGDDIWISVGCYLDYVIVEDSVLIGQHVVILSGKNHHNTDRLDIPIKLQGNPPKQPVTIGRGAWIGANATIMADVGHDAIVGAGSVVTKPVEPFAIVAGNPARLIRMRNAL